MNFFFDTSALIKYFHLEEGSEKVIGLINNVENTIYISELAKIEFLSAIYRRYRTREINKQELKTIVENFNLSLENFRIEPLESLVINYSEHLLVSYAENHSLRAFDAIHLASFLLIAEDNWIFVCSDDILCKVAESANAKVLNPART